MSEYKTLFEKLAKDRNISVEEMRSIIAARIERYKRSRSYTEGALGKDSSYRRCAYARGVATICGQKIGG